MLKESGEIEIITKKVNNEYILFLKNNSAETIYPDEVIVMSGKMPFERNTRAYCDGFNMLSQYTGTVENMKCIGPYTDCGHYKLPQKDKYFTGYNYALFFEEKTTLWGFTSCRRFCGEIRFNSDKYEIAERLYNIPIESGETIELESFCILAGEKNSILDTYAKLIQSNHSARKPKILPSGWCSWYCFGADVTEKDIENNMQVMKESFDFMKYVLIDDGYQDKMGDWLKDNENFGNMNRMCEKIRSAKALPAIWVAPFVAEKDSEILLKHPEYFVSDETGKPLAADKVSFGGWRCAPWYMLDGTNPEAVEYIKTIFVEMKKRYGCNYFKLDANMWGVLPFGKRYDSTKTPIEAYRAVMTAICEAVGEDGFILGCNAPMWASLGLVDGMRTSGDVSRNFDTFVLSAKENLFRAWQNNKFWLCDPDCITMAGNVKNMVDGGGNTAENNKLSEAEFDYCAAYIFASGAEILFSGDDMTLYSERQIEIINKLENSDNSNMCFKNDEFEIIKNKKYCVILNSSDDEETFNLNCEKMKDFFCEKEITNPIKVPRHSGRIIEFEAAHFGMST